MQQTRRDIARYAADEVGKIGAVELLTDGSELPVFAFALKGTGRPYTVFDVSERHRERSWLISELTFPRIVRISRHFAS